MDWFLDENLWFDDTRLAVTALLPDGEPGDGPVGRWSGHVRVELDEDVLDDDRKDAIANLLVKPSLPVAEGELARLGQPPRSVAARSCCSRRVYALVVELVASAPKG